MEGVRMCCGGSVGSSEKQDAEKRRFWQRMIGEAARSDISIGEICRQLRLEEAVLLAATQAAGRSGRTEDSEPRRCWRGRASLSAVRGMQACRAIWI